MLRCDARGMYMSKTMECFDFREIFLGAERPIYTYGALNYHLYRGVLIAMVMNKIYLFT